MTHHIEDVIDVLAELSEKKGLKVAVSESIKGGVITGITATAGGILLGPLGLALGGLLGGVAAFANSNSKFKSVVLVLQEMTPIEKKRLYDKINKAVRNINPHEIVALAALILRSQSIQELALKELANYLNSEMNLRLL